jgi:hypothetical protein
MKRSGTTITFIVLWAAVLFAALVIGVCIREIRFQRARIETAKNTEIRTGNSRIQTPSETGQLVEELAQKSPIPGRRNAEKPGNFFPGGDPGAEEPRGSMRERLANMSEEEIAQMWERFGPRGRRGGERFQNMTEEERARFREERERMRERFANMSEEERAQMRERFGGRRRQGQPRRGSADPNTPQEENGQRENN